MKKNFHTLLNKKSGLNFNRRRGRRSLSGAKAGLFLTVQILGTIGLAFLFAYVFFCGYTVSGVSMEPSLLNGKRLIVSRVESVISPKPGDVVAFHTGNSQKMSVNFKRVAAVPGDEIYIEKGILYINGEREKVSKDIEPMEEAGIAKNPITLGEGEYFLLGDNRNNSEDSRYESIGLVKKKDIVGKAWFCVSFPGFGFVN